MESSKQNKFSDTENMEIKIYSDFYADLNYVLVGYKDKRVVPQGVLFIPYKKPNIFARIFAKIFGRFARKSEAAPLSKDADGMTLYSTDGE